MNALAHQELRALTSQPRMLDREPDVSVLTELASGLLAWTRRHELTTYKRASASEELLYPLHAAEAGAAVYLLSDGVNSKSPAHEHHTWAVIVGIAGRELNRMFTLGPDRQLRLSHEQVVGPGDTLVLESAAIHSTVVVGTEPTFHIHVYGKALERLAPFSARTFEAR
jgi:predicted metal-dependent enzyme (double-stranded beta helix superfamily)